MKAGYKQTEVGVIPEDWDSPSLRDVCTMKSGEGITAALIDDGSRFPCYGGNGLRGYTKRFTHEGDYALVGRQGALCGNVIGVSGKFFASEHAVVVTAKANADIRFLTYVLGEMRLNQHSESSAQPGLSVAKILTLPIASPNTITEQRAIAAALSDVDALIGSLDKLIAKKRDLKQAAMQQLLTGSTRLPGFGGKWEMSTVGREFEIQLGKMLDSEKNAGIPMPYVGNKAVQWGRVDVAELGVVRMTDADIKRYRLVRGDLLVCEGGEVGRAAIWDAPLDECYYQKALHRLRPTRGFDPEFMLAMLRHWVDAGSLSDYVTQTSIAHLTREKFATVPLPVPSHDEQHAIAAVLSDMDAELAALEQRRDKTKLLKQGMMQELLTGRVRLV